MSGAGVQSMPQRVRRPIAERVGDFLHHEFPLDQTGDERLGEFLGQLRDIFEGAAPAREP